MNAFAGALAVMFLFRGKLDIAAYLMIIAAVFDFFDGLVARAFKASSELGKQLDSLSDVISFGIVPAMIGHLIFVLDPALQQYPVWLSFVPAIMVPFSAYRLGKFNLDTRQSISFIGLPTPANGLFWAGLALIFSYYRDSEATSLCANLAHLLIKALEYPIVIPTLSIVLSFMLVSEIPLFAMKFKGYQWKGNEVKIIFIGLSLLLIAALQIVATPFIFLLYILLSLIQNFINRNHELRS